MNNSYVVLGVDIGEKGCMELYETDDFAQAIDKAMYSRHLITKGVLDFNWVEVVDKADITVIYWASHDQYDNKLLTRINTVRQALGLDLNDALKVVGYLKDNNYAYIIDEYADTKEDNALTDVHRENNFCDMIDWIYEGYKPSDIIYLSSKIEDHKKMLELSSCVIFWYQLF